MKGERAVGLVRVSVLTPERDEGKKRRVVKIEEKIERSSKEKEPLE